MTESGLAMTTMRAPWAVRAGEWLFRHRSFLPLVLVGVPLSVATLHPLARPLALAVIAAGIGIRFVSVAAAGPETRRRSRAVQRLVVHGPFALTRNPIYIGNFLIWVGIAVVAGDARFAGVAIVFFAMCYSLIVRYEESVLASTFGAEYLAYMATTPRWMPRRLEPPARPVGRYDWRRAWRREWNTAINIAVAAGILVVKARWPAV